MFSCPVRLTQRALQFEPGVVAGEGGAAVGVRAEEALRDPAVLFAGERPCRSAPDRRWTRAAPSVTDLHRHRVRKQIALGEGVGRVLLPAVVDVHGGKGGVDAAGGKRGVGVGHRPLADDEDVDPELGEFDRRAQPGPPVPMTSTEAAICCSVIVYS